MDDRTTRHPGYLVSQCKRKPVEEIFGWMKTFGGFRKSRFIGRRRTHLAGTIVAAAYNLLRICRLLPVSTWNERVGGCSAPEFTTSRRPVDAGARLLMGVLGNLLARGDGAIRSLPPHRAAWRRE